MVLTYHAVVSMAIPIALAEITHPSVRTTPWLRAPGLVVTGVAALLGFGLLRLIPLSADPHYLMPWPDDVVIGALAVLVILLAGRGPRVVRPIRPARSVPSPVAVAVLAFLGTVVFLGLLTPMPGARHAGYAPTGATAWIAVAGAALLAAVAALLAARWTSAPGWDDRRTALALTAALLGHTLIGLLTLTHQPLDRGVLIGLGVAEAVLLAVLVRRVAARRGTPRNEYLYSGARPGPGRAWEA